MLTAIAKTIVALNANVRKEQIAAGFAWGLLFALVPAGNLLWIGLFVLSFFFKLHRGTQLLGIALLKPCFLLLAPLLDALGWLILNMEALQPAWTALYNLPLAPFTRFNNTLVAGGLAAGIVLWVPAFLGIRALVPLYREKLAPRIAGSRAYKAFIKLPLVSALAKAVSAAERAAGALQ